MLAMVLEMFFRPDWVVDSSPCTVPSCWFAVVRAPTTSAPTVRRHRPPRLVAFATAIAGRNLLFRCCQCRVRLVQRLYAIIAPTLVFTELTDMRALSYLSKILHIPSPFAGMEAFSVLSVNRR